MSLYRHVGSVRYHALEGIFQKFGLEGHKPKYNQFNTVAYGKIKPKANQSISYVNLIMICILLYM